jgi:hypothetical protein
MPPAASIALGLVTIAAAILITHHWDVVNTTTAVLRFNRWTGELQICRIDADYVTAHVSGTRLECTDIDKRPPKR